MHKSQHFLQVFFFFLVGAATAVNVAEFQKSRNDVIKHESERFLGGSLTLNSKEQLANIALMDAKHREYDRSLKDLNFPPAVNYFQAKPLMLQSQVFQFIQQMPKGYPKQIPV